VRSTAAPGRLETSTSSPYAAEIATPSTAVSPTARQSAAAVASRTPQPATVAGISMLTSTGATRGASVPSGVSTCTARAAAQYMAT
jgi:hypothetical protein